PAGLVVEVYDNPQPAPRIERVLAVGALSSRSRIVFPIVGPLDPCEERLGGVEQPVAATLRVLGRSSAGVSWGSARSARIWPLWRAISTTLLTPMVGSSRSMPVRTCTSRRWDPRIR